MKFINKDFLIKEMNDLFDGINEDEYGPIVAGVVNTCRKYVLQMIDIMPVCEINDDEIDDGK